MDTLYKETQERLIFLESQEQTEEIKIRINEITLAIVRIQQLKLRNLLKENKSCSCKHPQDCFNGTGLCRICNKQIPINFLSKHLTNSGIGLSQIYKSEDGKIS